MEERSPGGKQTPADDGVEDNLSEHGTEEEQQELAGLEDDVVVQTMSVWHDHDAEFDGEVVGRPSDRVVDDCRKTEYERRVPETAYGREDPPSTAVEVGLDRMHDGDVSGTNDNRMVMYLQRPTVLCEVAVNI